MSTVDAAIIDFVVNNPGSGTGTKYTAGDAIDLTSNKISVKYDPATMQLVDGKISALPQSGGTGVVLSAGDAINIADNKINVKYNTGTMELVNGALSAKTSTTYTAGDAIDLTSNKIAVKYDPNTIQLKDGKISAKTGSLEGYATTEYVNTEIAKIPTDRISVANGSLRLDNQHKGLIYDATVGESGSFGIFTESTDNADINLMSHWNKTDKYKLATFSMPDSAIRFYVETLNGVPQTNSIQFFKDGTIEAMNDAKKITIKAETVDIQGKFIHNGNDLTSNKCPVPTEDVLTRGSAMYQGLTYENGLFTMQLGTDVKSGNIIRLRYAVDGTILSYILVIIGKITEEIPEEDNAYLIDQNPNGVIRNARIHRVMSEYLMTVEDFYEDTFPTFGSDDTELGIFINESMSYQTLCTVVQYLHPSY